MLTFSIGSYFSQSPEVVLLLWFTLYPTLSPSLHQGRGFHLVRDCTFPMLCLSAAMFVLGALRW